VRLLANENIPRAAVAALIAAGHDVAWVRQAAPGMPDPEVLAMAEREKRILVTFDNDFGELTAAADCRGSAESSCYGYRCARRQPDRPGSLSSLTSEATGPGASP
jgi:hypothetical protein